MVAVANNGGCWLGVVISTSIRRAVDSPLLPLNGGEGYHCCVVFITIIIVGSGPFVASTSSAASGVVVAAGGDSRDIRRSCSHRERERPT